MQTVYSVGSVSDAMQGKRLLEKHGIRAYIRKTNADGERGCGYALLIINDSPRVSALLRAGGITVSVAQGRDRP